MILVAGCQEDPLRSPVQTPASPLSSATLSILPTPQPVTGLIAFHSNCDGGYQVYIMDSNGENVRRLTDFAPPNSEPTWSPDGSKVAFTSGKDDINNFNLYMINADGTNAQPLIEPERGYNWYPSWSPLGDKIVYQSTFERQGRVGIFVVEIDTGQITSLSSTEITDSMPAWSPDGQRIVFVSDQDGDIDIYTMKADGSERVRLTHDSGRNVHPAWSSDGSKIVFISTRDGEGDIYLMNSDGSEQTRLTFSPTYSEWNPSWAERGTKILFAAGYENDWEIYIMNADGSDITRLTFEAGDDRHPVWFDLE